MNTIPIPCRAVLFFADSAADGAALGPRPQAAFFRSTLNVLRLAIVYITEAVVACQTIIIVHGLPLLVLIFIRFTP